MRLRNSLSLGVLAALAGSLLPAASFSYHVLGDDPGSWPAVLSSIGLINDAGGTAGVVVAPGGTNPPPAEWVARVGQGTILILEGESPLAAAFGFRATAKRVTVRSVVDVRAPKLSIVWEKA